MIHELAMHLGQLTCEFVEKADSQVDEWKRRLMK